MGPVAVLSQNRLASAGNIVGSGEKSAEVEEGFKEIVVGTHLSADPISSRGCTAAGAPNPPVGQALAASIWRQARRRGRRRHFAVARVQDISPVVARPLLSRDEPVGAMLSYHNGRAGYAEARWFRRSILAARIKSFSCRPLIFLVRSEMVA